MSIRRTRPAVSDSRAGSRPATRPIGDAALDEFRIVRAERFVGQAPSVQRAGPEIVDRRRPFAKAPSTAAPPAGDQINRSFSCTRLTDRKWELSR